MGKLVQVATETVTSAVSTVELSGINTDDVYMVTFHNVRPTVDNTIIQARIIKSDDTADSTANYDRAVKALRADTTFTNVSSVNQTAFDVEQLGTGTGEATNGIMYLYNFNNASEYNFVTSEMANYQSTPILIGGQGVFVNTVQQASKGLQFFIASNTIASGVFTMYKVL